MTETIKEIAMCNPHKCNECKELLEEQKRKILFFWNTQQKANEKEYWEFVKEELNNQMGEKDGN